MASRSRLRFALCCALRPSVAYAWLRGENSSKSVPMSTRPCALAIVTSTERPVSWLRANAPGRATQPGSDTASIHPDLDVVRAVAVPEDEHVSGCP